VADGIRFHFDENVDPVIAAALRQYGIDVTTTVSAGLRTNDDEAQVAFARHEGPVLVTHDDDFLRLAARDPDHAGIAYCHLEARSIGEMIQGLRLIYEVLSPDEMQGHVEFL